MSHNKKDTVAQLVRALVKVTERKHELRNSVSSMCKAIPRVSLTLNQRSLVRAHPVPLNLIDECYENKKRNKSVGYRPVHVDS